MDTAWIEVMGLYIEAHVRYGGLATQLICCIVDLKSPRAMPYLLDPIDMCIG